MADGGGRKLPRDSLRIRAYPGARNRGEGKTKASDRDLGILHSFHETDLCAHRRWSRRVMKKGCLCDH